MNFNKNYQTVPINGHPKFLEFPSISWFQIVILISKKSLEVSGIHKF